MTKAFSVMYSHIDLIKHWKSLGKTYKQVANLLSTENCAITELQVGNFCRQNKIISLGASFTNKGDGNPAKRPEVRNKISATVTKLWDEGVYDNRINGMTNVKGINHPKCSILTYSCAHYREKYLYYTQQPLRCARCNKVILYNEKFDIHHVDENHENFLLTNLQGLCVPCHGKFHLTAFNKNYKCNYQTVSQSFLIIEGNLISAELVKDDIQNNAVVNVVICRRQDKQCIMTPCTSEIVNEVAKLSNYKSWFANSYNITEELELLWKLLSLSLKGIQRIEYDIQSKIHESIDNHSLLIKAAIGEYENEWLQVI